MNLKSRNKTAKKYHFSLLPSIKSYSPSPHPWALAYNNRQRATLYLQHAAETTLLYTNVRQLGQSSASTEVYWTSNREMHLHLQSWSSCWRKQTITSAFLFLRRHLRIGDSVCSFYVDEDFHFTCEEENKHKLQLRVIVYLNNNNK